jgi:2-polyprenyl-3-methyl-5-hydroxy-6-metoxy-1,4-benzoquinol methylase
MTTTKQTQSKAADFWNQWQNARNLNQSQYVDWGDHPTILALVYADLFGSPTISVFDYLKQAYPIFSNSTVLSLCAGDGSFEKLLLNQGVFGSITGIDIAPERVATANAQAAEFESRLKFIVGDVNKGEFGEASYDVVFAKAALHHVEQLESIYQVFWYKEVSQTRRQTGNHRFFWANSVSVVRCAIGSSQSFHRRHHAERSAQASGWLLAQKYHQANG